MISEGSCDTEDWSNDAENSVLHHRNKLYFKEYKNRKPILEIAIRFHNIIVFLMYFWSNKYSLDKTPLKTLKNLTDPKLLNDSVYSINIYFSYILTKQGDHLKPAKKTNLDWFKSFSTQTEGS